MTTKMTPLLISTAVVIIAGGIASVLAVTACTQPWERTAGAYAIGLTPSFGLVVAALGLREHRAAAVTVLLSALAVGGLSLFWATKPLQEWSGLALLLVIPIEWGLCFCPVIVLAVSRRRRRT
jgi:hypothetical protein